MRFKTALFSGLYSNLTLERCFQAASKYGYDGVEVGGFRPHTFPMDILKDDGASIRRMCSEYGLTVVDYVPENTGSPYSLVFADNDMNAESIEYFKRGLDAAAAIESPYCMLACNYPGWGRYLGNVKKRFIENMKILAEYAASVNVTIILEPVTPFEGNIIVTSDDVKWALDEVNHPNFKCMIDLAAPFTAGEPLSSYWEKIPAEDIRHIHFVDCEKDCEDHLIPGEAAMCFPAIVSYLEEVRYEGYLSLELFSRYNPEPDFAAKKGMEVFKELLS